MGLSTIQIQVQMGEKQPAWTMQSQDEKLHLHEYYIGN